jgi:ATP synthase mitochondrial F1 complex assembly factor 1
MFHLAVRSVTPRILPSSSRRCISSTSFLRSSTPQWEELIGGREGVERKKKAYEGKYAAAMEAKAKAEGTSVEELKQRQAALEAKQRAAAEEARALKQAALETEGSASPVAAGSEKVPEQGQVVRPLPSAEGSDTARAARAFTKPKDATDAPVKVSSRV